METGVRKTLAGEVAKFPGARLADLTLGSQRGTATAWAVIRTPELISPEQLARLNDLVNNATGRTVNLHVRSVITAETTRSGYVYEPDFSPDGSR